MIVQAGLDAVCSTLQRPLRAGDLLQPAGARCAPFAAGALLLQMNREVLSFCRSSAPAAKGPIPSAPQKQQTRHAGGFVTSRGQPYNCGPALTMASATSNFLKFWMNRPARSRAAAS